MSPITQDVHLLVVPLAMYYDHHLGNFDIAARYSPLHRTPFRRLQHWAVQVGVDVYEVTRRGTGPGGSPEFRCIRTVDWWNDCDNRKAIVRRHFLGVTNLPQKTLEVRAGIVWDEVMKVYSVASSNCQTFASIFQRWVIDNRELTRERRADIQPLPWSLNPFISIKDKLDLAQQYCARSEHVLSRWRPNKQKDSPLALPRRPTSVWLDAFKNEARHGENAEDDFFKIVQHANQRLRPRQRRTLWQYLRQMLRMQSTRLRLKD